MKDVSAAGHPFRSGNRPNVDTAGRTGSPADDRQAGDGSGESAGEQAVLIVGVCAGHRCAALRRLDSAEPRGASRTTVSATQPTPSDSEQLVRQAIRARRDAVLVSLPCLGPCHQASVAALGTGLAARNSLTWLGRPSLFGLTQAPDRARAFADWITSDAPDPQTLPDSLREHRRP